MMCRGNKMTSFIKLTNATKEHRDKDLIINTKYIVSIFPIKNENDEEITIVYGALQTSWNVKESIDIVLSKIEQASQEE